MSSDNYWLVRRTRDDRFVALMGFNSDEIRPSIDPARIGDTFATPELAIASVSGEYAEYGSSIDPECFEPGGVFSARVAAEDKAVLAVIEHLGFLASLRESVTQDDARYLVEIVESTLIRGLRERIGALEERLRGRQW